MKVVSNKFENDFYFSSDAPVAHDAAQGAHHTTNNDDFMAPTRFQNYAQPVYTRNGPMSKSEYGKTNNWKMAPKPEHEYEDYKREMDFRVALKQNDGYGPGGSELELNADKGRGANHSQLSPE